jgi:hypothetical protein
LDLLAVERYWELADDHYSTCTIIQLSLQSTYCSTVVEYCQSVKRSIHVINLDPAAEHFSYPVEAGEGEG